MTNPKPPKRPAQRPRKNVESRVSVWRNGPPPPPPLWVASQTQTFYPSSENCPEVHRDQLQQAAQNRREKEEKQEKKTKKKKAQPEAECGVKRRPKVNAEHTANYIERAIRSAQPGRTVSCRWSMAPCLLARVGGRERSLETRAEGSLVCSYSVRHPYPTRSLYPLYHPYPARSVTPCPSGDGLGMMGWAGHDWGVLSWAELFAWQGWVSGFCWDGTRLGMG
jgi:hypothetical protein